MCELRGSSDIFGAILRGNDKVVIAVNPAQHPNRQRLLLLIIAPSSLRSPPGARVGKQHLSLLPNNRFPRYCATRDTELDARKRRAGKQVSYRFDAIKLTRS